MRRRSFLQLGASLPLIFAGCSKEEMADERVALSEDGVGLEPKDHLEPTIDTGLADIVAVGNELDLIRSIHSKLKKVMNHVGFGNFNILDFDSTITYGKFTREELDKIEELFYFDAKKYGFFGEKVSSDLTAKIDPKSVYKVPYTGHYLFKEHSLKIYEQVLKEVGENIFLTSGIRAVPKQLYLFLSKTLQLNGNYSEASKSLAPAGYSYHLIGDFDVGKVGFGERNFTSDFAGTKEYEKLRTLGYVSIRYPQGNPFGVYFEPWHIEVV